MKKRYFLFSLLAAAAFAQGVPPNNGWYTGREYFPWDQATESFCTYWKTNDILTGLPIDKPAKNVSVAAVGTVQPGSGYHTHSGGARPYPTVLTKTPATGQTDQTGCVRFKWSSAGNYAGWITFQYQPAGPFATSGVNHRFRYLDWGPNGSKVDFVQYNESVALVLNQPFGLHPDTRHNPSPGSGFDNARYGTPASEHLVLRISDTFFALSAGLLGSSPIPLDLIRGSLPDGGYADNEVGVASGGPYVTGEWLQSVRWNEAHQLGVEWDFGNPLLLTPLLTANGNHRAWDLFNTIVYSHDCVLGPADPYGSKLPSPDAFWVTMDVVHVVCSVAAKNMQ
jgi:hypothetical protein